jgi:hypothetical protein
VLAAIRTMWECGAQAAGMANISDPNFVKGVFDRCSDRYITFSLICSFGFTERWRQQSVAAMPALRAGSAGGYDLMAGPARSSPIW